MRVIYLAAGRSLLDKPGIVYNDLYENRDIKADMLCVDLNSFDVLIATPPCNFYSRARGNNQPSVYALKTAHLLPCIIDKFISTGKFFIVENVRNKPLFKKLGLYDKNCFIYTCGRHTYWTNVFLNLSNIPQTFDFMNKAGYGVVRLKSYVQGGSNVDIVLNYFIQVCESYFKKGG